MVHSETAGVSSLMRVYYANYSVHVVSVKYNQYQVTAISSLDVSISNHSTWRRLCFRQSWMPDIETANRETITQLCGHATARNRGVSATWIDTAESICCYFVSKTMSQIGNDLANISSQPHLQKYVEWMKILLQQDRIKDLLTSQDLVGTCGQNDRHQAIINQLDNQGPEGKVLKFVGLNLAAILQGKIDVVEAFFSDGLILKVYKREPKLEPTAESETDKKPELKVLNNLLKDL